MGEMSSTFFSGSRTRATIVAAARVVVLAAVASLCACKTYDSLTQRVAQSITPYRITVVQGNFVSAEAASKLRVGMSREEVGSILGTPLLTDLFHTDRWDYVFYFKRGSTSVVQQRDLIVNFVGDRVASWTGADDLPSEYELIAEIDGDRKGLKKAKAEAAASAASEPAVQTPAGTGAVGAASAAAGGVGDAGSPPGDAPQHIALPPAGVASSPDPSTEPAPANAANLQNQPVLAPHGAQEGGSN